VGVRFSGKKSFDLQEDWMANSNLKMSGTGLTFLKNEEGPIDGLYDDPSGFCTYGIGYLVHKQHSYLLKTAAMFGNFSTYIRVKWPNTKSATKYLDRTAKFDSKFDSLKTTALSIPGAAPFVNAEINVLGTAIESLLMRKLPSYEAGVARTISHINLSQNEFDALVSFSFNEGVAAFEGSMLAKLINSGKFKTGDAKMRQAGINNIDLEFQKWNKSNGTVLPGLVSRRTHESALFLQDARLQLQKLQAGASPLGARPSGNSTVTGPSTPGTYFTPVQPPTIGFAFPASAQNPICPSYPSYQTGKPR
jgi:lysozyme